ncbi:hypothetical protein [Rhodalgimonas zhirmunskyi]|uniref:Uncharacterized protein n=1 Tax=Rhodalgimonas zhirmunskyi TaxID=2964767 RepID=A0AAJ1X705_9RHOB|nr:hypothetical protein [Rhodoalgimonas zhirmunskyi]MDQ2095214.1 hypothetical protein [Rhodoalgimonas zhirmunskyi]
MKPICYLATLGLMASAPPALAGTCPTRDDLDRSGIHFDVADGAYEVFRTHTDGILSSLYFEGEDAAPLRVLLAQGIYLLETADMDTRTGTPDPASRVTYAFPMAAPKMPLPTPGGAFSVSAAVMENGDIRREDQTYTFGPETQIIFGPCTYKAIEIKITYPGEDSSDTLTYLPDLGLAYLSSATYDGNTETYTYLAVRKAD